jgi:hypothetical protein
VAVAINRWRSFSASALVRYHRFLHLVVMELLSEGASLWYLDALHVSTCEVCFDFKLKKLNSIGVETSKRTIADDLKAGVLFRRQFPVIGLRFHCTVSAAC